MDSVAGQNPEDEARHTSKRTHGRISPPLPPLPNLHHHQNFSSSSVGRTWNYPSSHITFLAAVAFALTFLSSGTATPSTRRIHAAALLLPLLEASPFPWSSARDSIEIEEKGMAHGSLEGQIRAWWERGTSKMEACERLPMTRDFILPFRLDFGTLRMAMESY